MNKLMAIDPSINQCGIAIYNIDTKELLKERKIPTIKLKLGRPSLKILNYPPKQKLEKSLKPPSSQSIITAVIKSFILKLIK